MPKKELTDPVVFDNPALEPKKALLLAVFDEPALLPKNALKSPPVFDAPAFVPKKALLIPVMILAHLGRG